MAFDIWTVLTFIGQAILAAGATLAVASTKLGEKLFSHHLDRRLARLKHDQDEKIEGLRAQLAHLSDRGKHSNQREFDALSAIWEKLIDAYLSTNTAIVRFMEHPDLNAMTADDISAFLNTTEFSDAQKTQVMEASDKNKIYSRIVELRLLNRARRDIMDTRLLLRKRGIFVPASLASQIEDVIKILNSAEVERYVAFRHDTDRIEAQSALLGKGEQIIEELGAAVRARLLRIE